jgi:spore coat polysaccharide biosynthesis predicted glycosyltransferase SpsG/ribosomal protein S18 acetylase RimI-like enzyme
MVIDDLADRAHECDLLLDQSLGRETSDYSALVPADCVVLAGPRYALLRPEFAEWRDYSLNRRRSPKARRILVAMGGVDRQNATCQVLEALRKCDLAPTTEIAVVMGATAPWLQEVRARANQMPWRTDVLVNASDMAHLMADCDIAIGAAGTTSWERCCLGVPTILLTLAQNQIMVANALDRCGAAISVGEVGSGTAAIVSAINELICHPDKQLLLSSISSTVCDGQGAHRCLQALETNWASIVAESRPDVCIRQVRSEDVADLWRWRNDPETRRNSLNTELVPWALHVQWFNASLSNPDRLILIGEAAGAKCGMIRFDRRGQENAWEISIGVAPEFRARGVGTALLSRACAELASRRGGVISLLASVRCTNVPSLRMFKKCGFEFEAQTDGLALLGTRQYQLDG